uniref:LIM zinc-binding domain-containing protein n=1 Tax=Strigamia maritima TaxID=126957 RepID=T1IPJ8_STRMM
MHGPGPGLFVYLSYDYHRTGASLSAIERIHKGDKAMKGHCPDEVCCHSFELRTMPVTTRFSTKSDKNYDDTNQPSPPLTAQTIGAASVSSGGTTHSSPNGSISSYSRTNSVDSLDDSHSSSSGGCSGHCRQLSNDSSVNSGSDYLPTRSKRSSSSKTTHNPLQFVKTGTCTLYKKAEEQIKKSEEVKKLKTHTRQDEEEWQNNLDNWKSKRRQISHKTVERTEERKKLEVESEEKSAKSKKSKTFSEMMEERSKRGRKLNYFSEDWDNDDFDKKRNGWSGNSSMTSPNKYTDDESDASSIEKSRFESPVEPSPQLQSPPVVSNNSVAVNGKRISTNGKSESSSVSENGSTPTEEYTFDKAIQNYVQYAENHQRKMAKSTNNGVVKTKSDYSSFEARYRDADIRSGGTAMTIVVTLVKSTGNDQRDFGFTTRGQGRGLVFVDSVNSFGPADNADLRCDDEILAVNGESLALNLTQSPQSCNNSAKKKPSRVEERKAVFSGEQFLESPTTPDKKPFVREQSPRVDIRKRRSLFEGANHEQIIDQSHQQTPRATDSRAFKNKIASFDKPAPVDLPKQNVVIDSEGSFEEKLKSFEKMEREERRNDRRSSLDRRQQFKNRLASFEKLESLEKSDNEKPNIERKQSLIDKLATFEKQESFERSQSCDLLDLGCEEMCESPKKVKNNDLDWIDVAENHQNGGRPRIIDVVAKESSPEPVLLVEKTKEEVFEPQEVIEEVMEMKIIDPLHYSTDVSWENRFLALERKFLSTIALDTNTPDGDGALNHNFVEEEIGFNLDCHTPSATHIKSCFELAESLQETPIVASNPSSPFQNKRLLAVSLENNVNVGNIENIQIDQVEQNLNEIERMAQELNFDDIIDAPIRLVEPPKEKPPPPPSQQEKTPELSPDVKGTVNLRRAESSKRIRKEMIQRRSDFLGIDPSDNQEYLDFELNTPAPPNMEAILRAEKSFEERLRQHSMIETVENNWRKSEIDEPVKINKIESKASEDDITRKEREIIENLEREEERKRNEIIAYFGDDPQDRLEEERLLSELDLLQEEKFRRELHERERRLQQHEELLRLEKEKMKRQQEALSKEKDEYQRQVQQYQQKFSPAVRRKNAPQQQQPCGNHHENTITVTTTNNLSVSRNLKGDVKPLKSISSNKTCLSNPEARDRDEIKVNQFSAELTKNPIQQHQPMTKQTLHALSALPKAKITDGDRWIARRKPEAARRDPSAYNQHWLIQEAEMRRISEQQNRQAKSPGRAQQRPTQVQTQFYDQVDSGHSGHYNMLQRSVGKSPEDNGEVVNSSTTNNYSHSTMNSGDSQMLSVSGKKKCSHCAKELGRGAAMIIESLQLFYHIHCFKCCVCHVQLGNGLSGADVRVRNQKLHCHNCYSNDEGNTCVELLELC